MKIHTINNNPYNKNIGTKNITRNSYNTITKQNQTRKKESSQKVSFAGLFSNIHFFKKRKKRKEIEELRNNQGKKLFSSYTATVLANEKSEIQERAIKIAQLEDENQERLFENHVAIFLAKKDDEIVEYAIQMRKIKNEKNERFFNYDYYIETILKQGKSAAKKAIELAQIKDEEGKNLLNEDIVTTLIKENDEDIKKALELIKIKDKYNRRVFGKNSILKIIKEITPENLCQINSLIQRLPIDYYDDKDIFEKALDEFLISNNDIDLKDFIEYIDQINIKGISEIAPIMKKFKAKELLDFYNYHYRNGKKTTFKRKDLILDKDITEYLSKNYLNARNLSALYCAYPLTSRNVGKIPNDWLDKTNEKDRKKVTDKIYEAIEEFLIDHSKENLSEKLSRLLSKKVTVNYIDSGTFGSGYKISIEGAKTYCLKIFHTDAKTEYLDITKHGRYAEVQTGIFLNSHSNEFVKMYFGKVCPKIYNDGFLVTQFLDLNTKIDENILLQEKGKYRISNSDKSHNMIQGRIYDYGGTEVKLN